VGKAFHGLVVSGLWLRVQGLVGIRGWRIEQCGKSRQKVWIKSQKPIFFSAKRLNRLTFSLPIKS